MLELPTRTSSVFICHCDIVPDEDDAALSLPQDLYISTITGWTDSSLEPAIYKPMRDRYRRAFPVAIGQYVTEIDMNNDDANVRHSLFFSLIWIELNNSQTRVLSDTALTKFLKIREKYDPNSIFPNYRKFIMAYEKMEKLERRNML